MIDSYPPTFAQLITTLKNPFTPAAGLYFTFFEPLTATYPLIPHTRMP